MPQRLTQTTARQRGARTAERPTNISLDRSNRPSHRPFGGSSTPTPSPGGDTSSSSGGPSPTRRVGMPRNATTRAAARRPPGGAAGGGTKGAKGGVKGETNIDSEGASDASPNDAPGTHTTPTRPMSARTIPKAADARPKRPATAPSSKSSSQARPSSSRTIPKAAPSDKTTAPAISRTGAKSRTASSQIAPPKASKQPSKETTKKGQQSTAQVPPSSPVSQSTKRKVSETTAAKKSDSKLKKLDKPSTSGVGAKPKSTPTKKKPRNWELGCEEERDMSPIDLAAMEDMMPREVELLCTEEDIDEEIQKMQESISDNISECSNIPNVGSVVNLDMSPGEIVQYDKVRERISRDFAESQVQRGNKKAKAKNKNLLVSATHQKMARRKGSGLLNGQDDISDPNISIPISTRSSISVDDGDLSVCSHRAVQGSVSNLIDMSPSDFGSECTSEVFDNHLDLDTPDHPAQHPRRQTDSGGDDGYVSNRTHDTPTTGEVFWEQVPPQNFVVGPLVKYLEVSFTVPKVKEQKDSPS